MKWWQPRLVRRPKPEERGWLPIPAPYLLIVWATWLVAILVVGLVLSGSVQTWTAVAVILLAWEAERRLEEPVAARLGTNAQAVLAFDVHRPMFSKVSAAAFIVEIAGASPLILLAFSSGLFQPDGVGVAFGLAILWADIVRDVLSRLRWHRSSELA